MSNSEIALLSAAIGGAAATLVGGFFSLINNWVSRRHEAKTQIRQLAIQIALENWKESREYQRREGFETCPNIDQISLYIAHATNLVAAMDGKMKTEDEVRSQLRKGFAIINAADEEINKNFLQGMRARMKK